MPIVSAVCGAVRTIAVMRFIRRIHMHRAPGHWHIFLVVNPRDDQSVLEFYGVAKVAARSMQNCRRRLFPRVAAAFEQVDRLGASDDCMVTFDVDRAAEVPARLFRANQSGSALPSLL